MNTTLAAIEDLGYAIETHGITADPASLSLLADDARELGVKPLLVDVMVVDIVVVNFVLDGIYRTMA